MDASGPAVAGHAHAASGLRRSARRNAVELPTLALGLGLHGAWIALTLAADSLPAWIWLPTLAWTVAWYGSFQHEAIHGHPTKDRRINTALAWMPYALWAPYLRYRATHLAHHRDQRLTCPFEDPESWYVTPATWRRLGRLGRMLLVINQTLVGRLLLGPPIAIARFLWDDGRRLARGDRRLARIWAVHAGGAAAVALWLTGVAGIPLWLYAVGVIYPATALTLLRSFAEHRAAADPARRTAVVRAEAPLAWLFLHNNLHVAHHARPRVPWYRLPQTHAALAGDTIADRGAGLFAGGYAEVFRRYAFRPIDHPIHPRFRPAGGGVPKGRRAGA